MLKRNTWYEPEALEKFLKKNSITKNVFYNKMTGKRIFGVIPMHTFGHPVRIEEIQNICYNYGITLIEDAAESLGSFYKGRHTGLWGKAAIISFNGNKPVTTGGGGMVISNDEKIIERVKHLSTTAKVKHPWEFIHDEIGYNMRMPNVNAAIGCAQMEYFDKILENKRETASMYKDFFKQYEDVIFFNEPQNCSSNYWLNVIMFKNKQIRDEFLEYSNSMGVQTRPVWKLIPTLLPYKDCFCDNIAIALELENRIVNIPSGYRE
jgi:dTDP-4-amino-4,6-dideoxygalactose transaminase